MYDFPQSFLVLLQQVSVGGLFALAAAPFHELDRAFFKSTAGVLFVLGFLGLWGKFEIYRDAAGTDLGTALDLGAEVCFLAAFALYLVSLWGERVYFRARIFSCAIFLGLASLVVGSVHFQRAPMWSVESLLYPLSFFLSALLLGAVTVGMLIGHWYLIDTGQSMSPLMRIFKFFFASLVIQTLFMAILPALIFFLGDPQTLESFRRLWSELSRAARCACSGRAGRPAGSFFPDMAHPKNSSYHGSDGTVLRGTSRGLCRGDLGKTDSRSHDASFLV